MLALGRVLAWQNYPKDRATPNTAWYGLSKRLQSLNRRVARTRLPLAVCRK